MKATITRKSSAKRTLAGILAAIAMMTATIPTAAAAADLQSDYPTAFSINAEEEPDFEAMLNEMSLEEILNVWANVDTSAAAAKKGTDDEIEQTDSTEDPLAELKELAAKYGKKLFKLGVEKLVESAPAPLNTMLKAPVSSLVDMALGENKKETSNDDVIKAIEQQAQEIQQQLKELEKNIIQNNQDTASSSTYGTAMDNFTAAANRCSNRIKGYLDDASLTDNQRAVKVAKLLVDENMTTKMDLVTLFLVDTPDTDQDNRNMFQVGYDLYKTKSLFSGEAIDKSQAYILKRVNTYIKNCLVVLEILKAQQRVTEFAPEEVAELDSTTRKMYDSLSSSQYDVKKDITALLSQLIKGDEANEKAKEDHREGVINKAKEYFSQDRFVYINRGKAYVPVNQKLYANTCRHFTYLEEGHRDRYWVDKNILNKMKVLTQTDIRYIAEQAKSEKKSINQYLRDIGFNTMDYAFQGHEPLLFDGDTFMKCNMNSLLSWGDEGVYGYRMESKTDYARTDRALVWHMKEMSDMHASKLNADKMNLYLVGFVSRDFVNPYSI